MKFLSFALVFFFSSSLYAQTSIGQEFHTKADNYREAGETLKAIDSYNQAIVAYQKERNYSNIFCALNGRVHCWKHLYYLTDDPIYAIFVQKDAEALSEFVNAYNINHRKHTVHYLMGTAANLKQDYPTAEKEYQEAIVLYPVHNAERGDWIAHLGEVMIRNGKKEEGKQTVFKGINIINENSKNLDTFLKNVWLSGAYLRMAKALQKADPEESRIYFEKAKEIIDKDTRLIIRKRQLEKYDEAN